MDPEIIFLKVIKRKLWRLTFVLCLYAVQIILTLIIFTFIGVILISANYIIPFANVNSADIENCVNSILENIFKSYKKVLGK